jgi:hypothetical protein
VLRYQLGQAYIGHTDYFPNKQVDTTWNWDPMNNGSNRFATVFLYHFCVISIPTGILT